MGVVGKQQDAQGTYPQVPAELEKLIRSNPADAWNALYRNPDYKDKPFADKAKEEIAWSAADKDPQLIFTVPELFQDKPYYGAVQEKAARTLITSFPSVLLDHPEYLEGKPYKEEVLEKAKRSDDASTAIFNFNQAHEEVNATRFASLKNVSPAQEFDMLTLAKDDTYPSTYNGILTDMLGKLKQNHQTLGDVTTPAQQENMGSFLQGAASYGRSDEALNVIPADKRPGVIKELADNAAVGSDLSSLGAMSHVMGSDKGQDATRHRH